MAPGDREGYYDDEPDYPTQQPSKAIPLEREADDGDDSECFEAGSPGRRAHNLRLAELWQEQEAERQSQALRLVESGRPSIPYTIGALFGGREHPDPDGEYCDIPTSSPIPPESHDYQI